MKSVIVLSVSAILTIFLSASAHAALSGNVKIDGSSTVFPITEAVAEEFGKLNPKVRVTVGTSGTGGGFEKFIKGEIDINDASRTIKDSESKKAKAQGLTYLPIPVAYDGISVVVNKENTWVDKLTIAELKKIWEPGSKVVTWKDVRSSWPDRKIKLYGPGTDSGTFDYFTEAINGKSQLSRTEFTKSEDDNVLVQGVEGDRDSLGYFGFAYYINNKSRLRSVKIDDGKGPIEPTFENILSGTYQPLSRTIYIYVSLKSAQRPEVNEFVKFYLTQAEGLVKEVGYVPLTKIKYQAALSDFVSKTKKK